ncbi:MAG: hypothetical protein DME46_10430 [Verrucomicrobia bacterium]|nr:MAG: hypothetical protein DME46_10430 [Verrucomicrobiota bacterium]
MKPRPAIAATGAVASAASAPWFGIEVRAGLARLPDPHIGCLVPRELEVDRLLCRAMPSKSAADAQDLENSQRSKDPSSRAA